MNNPYKPPVDVALPIPRAEAGDYVEASKGLRLANLALDYVGFMLLSLVLGVVLALAGLEDVLEGANDTLVGVFVIAGYYLGFEGLFGRTPGKFVTGTKVVDVNGGPPRFTQILGRTFSRLVPFEAFSFLGSDTGWHDRWSDTRVVRTRGV
jgi:uncharacterized RDD family membrane protein YckC